MFSTKKNVLQLVSLLKKAGIQDYILCPGSRNIPLVQSLVCVKGFRCISVTDERSAGFYAIGLIQALGRPVAVCCTSGSAVLNLHPAVCEAFYQQLPLLLLTADRPVEWIGQMDGQTLPQGEAFSSLVRKCVLLPEVKDEIEGWHCNRLINEALYALNYPQRGPVQIDIPIGEPFFDFSETELPEERLVEHYQTTSISIPAALIQKLNQSERTVLIIGQRSYQEENIDDLIYSCYDKGIVVMHEHLANIQTDDESLTLRHFDELLAIESVERDTFFHPHLVIYIGGHIVSKRLKHWLRTYPPKEVWWVTTDNSMPDTFQHLTATIQCSSPYQFLQQAVEQISCSENRRSYITHWKMAETRLRFFKKEIFKERGFCDITILQNFVTQLRNATFNTAPSIQVANSSMVRNLQLLDFSSDIRILCNRGVNGIEGSLSTAVGYSLVNKGLTFCLIGDLSFFYDLNALWHRPLPSSLRILLLNNGNGQIFHQLPHLQSPYLKSYISAAHTFHAEGWAKDAGLSYFQCDNNEKLERIWSRFFSENEDRAILVEVVTDSQTDEIFYKEFYNRLKQIQL